MDWLKGLFRNAKENPGTSGAGTLAFLAAITAALNAQFDGDPATIPNWEATIAFFFVWVQAIFSKDAKQA